jgi:hypothetical protein
MTVRKTIKPEVTIGLNLGAEERELLFDLAFVEEEILQRIRRMPGGMVQVQLTVDQLGSLAGSIAADINHTGDKARQTKLARIYEKIDLLLGSHPDGESTTRSEAVKLAQFAASVLVLAERHAEGGVVWPGSIGRTQKIGLKLTKSERSAILGLPGLKEPLKTQIDVASNGPRTFRFTVNDLAAICFALSETMLCAEVRDTVRPMRLAGKLSLVLADCLVQDAASRIKPPSPRSRPAKSKKTLYQLRISLKDIQPSIWRRIQVKDCSLVVLHKVIQAAMGWEDYHLYSFEIDGKEFGDPALIEDDLDMEDARATWLSEIVPEDGKRYRFEYTYDFGDGWKHEVLFEGCPGAEKGVRFPLCLEGERACPPEDSGGISGYEEYLEVMADREDEQHEDFLRWRGPFDPERFDLEGVNRVLRRVRR